MSKLTITFPQFSDDYDGRLLRTFVRQLEDTFQRIDVSFRLPAYTVTADKTLTGQDEVVLIDTSTGDVTITLPEVSDRMIKDRFEFTLVKFSALNKITVTPSGGNTINGASDMLLYPQWVATHLRAITNGWVLI